MTDCNMKCHDLKPSSGTVCMRQPIHHVQHNVRVGAVGGCVGGPACVCVWTWPTASVGVFTCKVWLLHIAGHTNRLSFWMVTWEYYWEIWCRVSASQRSNNSNHTSSVGVELFFLSLLKVCSCFSLLTNAGYNKKKKLRNRKRKAKWGGRLAIRWNNSYMKFCRVAGIVKLTVNIFPMLQNILCQRKTHSF